MKRSSLRTVVAGLAIGLASMSRAADQSFDPRVEIGALHESNLRLAPPPLDDKVSGGYVDALANWVTRTPLTELSLTPRVRATRYSGSGESGITNVFLSGDLNHRLTKGRLGLSVDVSKQEVLTSDLLYANGSDGLGTPGTGAAGLSFNDKKALFAVVQPTGRFTLGQRTELLIDTQYTRVDYDQTLAQVQNDYTDVSGSVGLSFQSTPRVRLVTNLTADKFMPEAGNRDANNLGVNVELWREQTELVSAFVRLGAVRTTFSSSGTASQTNANGGLGVQRNFATGQLFLQANRRVDASGSGQAVLRDELNARLGRKISERLLLAVSAAGVWTQPVAKDSALSKRRYFVASLGGEWRFRRTVSLIARYEYSSNRYQNEPSTPDSNGVYAGIVFEPHRRN